MPSNQEEAGAEEQADIHPAVGAEVVPGRAHKLPEEAFGADGEGKDNLRPVEAVDVLRWGARAGHD